MVASAILLSTGAYAQEADGNQGRVTQTSDGNLYVIKDSLKYQIEPVILSDDAIAATPDGVAVQRVDQLFASAPPPFMFSTRNGLKSEQELKDELAGAGYPGPWDVSSMLVAYGQTSASTAAAAAPAPAAPSFIAVSDAWIEGGLRLIANAPGHDDFHWGNALKSGFRVENRSGATLNFEVDKSVFTLQLSTGTRYRAKNVNDRTSVIVNDLRDGDGRDFLVEWDVDYPKFDADRRNAAVSYYQISASEFTSRIHNAQWREEVSH